MQNTQEIYKVDNNIGSLIAKLSKTFSGAIEVNCIMSTGIQTATYHNGKEIFVSSNIFNSDNSSKEQNQDPYLPGYYEIYKTLGPEGVAWKLFMLFVEFEFFYDVFY